MKQIDYLQAEYTLISELGMVFIPCSMQQQSNFKSYDNRAETIVSFSVEENYIKVSVKKSEQKKIEEGSHSIDELGRIVIPSWCRNEIRMNTKDILVLCLIDEETITIRTLETKDFSEPYAYDFFNAAYQ